MNAKQKKIKSSFPNEDFFFCSSSSDDDDDDDDGDDCDEKLDIDNFPYYPPFIDDGHDPVYDSPPGFK